MTCNDEIISGPMIPSGELNNREAFVYQSVFKSDLFSGQCVIVTGGGSGLGRCAAHELASLGAHVALVGRRLDRLQTVAEEIAQAGGRADCYVGDIRDETRVRELIAEIIAAHGRIDALVNNAGGQFPALLRDISANGWDAVVRSNLTGGFLMGRWSRCSALAHCPTGTPRGSRLGSDPWPGTHPRPGVRAVY